MSEIKLLPCPFCGGEAEATFLCDGNYNIIRCKTYNCIMNVAIPVLHKTKEEAIEKWNTRKPMERIIEKLEEKKTKLFVSGITNDAYEFGACHSMDTAIKVVKEEGGIE